ncbi:hypothetical protein D3C84_404150 [compost metagenome]
MAAVQLNAQAGDFLADVGKEGLDDRNQQRCPTTRLLASLGLWVAVFQIQLQGGVGREQAAAFAQGFLRQQHAPNIGVHDDRVGALVRRHRAADGPRLQALTGISEATLEGGLGDAQSLQANLEACIVHHGEHTGQPLIRFTDQPALCAVEVHHAGGRALDAHLVFQCATAQRIARPRSSIGSGNELGNQEQADALHPGRCIRQTGKDQMNDVGGQVLLATTDENLAAADLIAAVGLRLGTGSQQGKVGTGLGLGEAHGTGPFTADHFLQVSLFERLAAMAMQSQHRAFGEAGINAKRQRGGHQHFVEAGRNQLRETLAGELQRSGHARPAVIDVLPVGVAKSLGRCDVAVDQLTALLVTVAVQRRDHFGGEAGGFFEDAVDGFPVQPLVQPLTMAADIEHFVQHKTHVAQGSLILHDGPHGLAQWKRLPSP